MLKDTRAPASLARITVYPLKGARGFEPQAWPVEDSGLRLDRQWMLVDAEGASITQHECPRLALIDTAVEADDLVFAAPGVEAVRVPIHADPAARERIRSEWSESLWALSLAHRFDDWFSTALGMACRLVRASDTPQRWVDRRPEGQALHFQKSFPIHLVSQASLDDLNARLAAPVPMDRFRPNLTVSGTRPHEDDAWKRIQIGDAILQIVRRSDHRCGVPNIDQATAERGVEPLKTLATYRRTDRGIHFGQNVAIERVGELRVGDPVILLEP